jgi:hypothetical protein
MDNPLENRGSFQKPLDQIFETLENKNSGSMEEVFSDVYTVFTGIMRCIKPSLCNGFEGYAAAALLPPLAASLTWLS